MVEFPETIISQKLWPKWVDYVLDGIMIMMALLGNSEEAESGAKLEDVDH